MKLQITGSLVELHSTIEGFTKNKKAELESRIRCSTKKTIVLFSTFVFFVLTTILFGILNIYVWLNISLFISVFMFCWAFIYTLFTNENKIDVEYEVKQSVCDMFGNREYILDAHHLGRIFSVVSTSLSVSYGRAEICLLFECQTDSKTVEPYTLKVTLTKTSDINCQDTLMLDLEHGTGTCYYKDISTLRDITKNDVEFEVVNQFQPEG